LPDIVWCEVPAGEFIMGNDLQTDGNPKRTVILPTFWIAKYPITYRQFQAFLDAPDGFKNDAWWKGLAKRETERGEQCFKFWNHPREMVSWYDAIAFCRWLTARYVGAGLIQPSEGIRLPTEQQWEKVARGTDGRTYPYGNTFDAAKGNTRETGIGQTSAVGIFPGGASLYGVLDMSGNVWEWCLNEYSNPECVCISDTNSRVLRGGTGNYYQDVARAALRLDSFPDYRSDGVGFRVCASVPIHRRTDH
jgi:formylglycine-generating enzyme required for sulfatase activity